MFKHFVQEKIVLPVCDLFTGREISKYLEFLLKSRNWTRKQLEEFQNSRLRELIEYAYKNVPFYHDIMEERGLKPADIQTKADLSKLPIINKDIMRKEGVERFLSKAYPKSKMFKASSSGSTGQPFVYYRTKLSYSVNLAANLRGWYSFGWRLGDRYVKISQNPRKNWLKKLQDKITGCLYIATADLSDSHLHEIMCEIERYKPVVIRSYPDPLYLMAQYRLQHKDEFSYSPKVLTTTGNVLHDNVRAIIEEAFGCKIFDAYASEGNSNVFECTTHSCYHSSEEYGITEIVNDAGEPVAPGEAGHLVTTDLWNFAHPFIRYDVQDLVQLGNSDPCPCGNEHLKISKIWGRDNELLIAPSGRRYTVHHFTVFFEQTVTPQLNDSIDQFQFIQHKDKTTSLKVVVNDRFDDSVKNFLEEYWSTEFGSRTTVEVMDKIPIMHNNKRRFIIIEK